jgi:tRNA pseudouridine38-40 synthase
VHRYAFKVYYDGTEFYGFQRQPEVRTVENELLKALIKTRAVSTNAAIARFASAGRTDRFVSALGNAFAINTERELTPAAINSKLTDEIRAWASAEVPISFDPRQAQKRHYKYLLQSANRINLDLISQTGRLFLGKHDFRRFAYRPSIGSSMREIFEFSTIKLNEDFISISIVGDSFLRRMVRKIVGVLIYVASGFLQLAEVEQLFDPRGTLPRMGIPSANPENLILWDVDYGFTFQVDKYALAKLQQSLSKNLSQLMTKRMMLSALKELDDARRDGNCRAN